MKTKKEAETLKYTPPFIPLALPDILRVTGISRSMIYAMMDPDDKSYDSSFPLPLLFGKCKTMWRSDEIDKWLLSRERVKRCSP